MAEPQSSPHWACRRAEYCCARVADRALGGLVPFIWLGLIGFLVYWFGKDAMHWWSTPMGCDEGLILHGGMCIAADTHMHAPHALGGN